LRKTAQKKSEGKASLRFFYARFTHIAIKFHLGALFRLEMALFLHLYFGFYALL